MHVKHGTLISDKETRGMTIGMFGCTGKRHSRFGESGQDR
jgi:hypothetical protein